MIIFKNFTLCVNAQKPPFLILPLKLFANIFKKGTPSIFLPKNMLYQILAPNQALREVVTDPKDDKISFIEEMQRQCD